jgi:hypothetical protein
MAGRGKRGKERRCGACGHNVSPIEPHWIFKPLLIGGYVLACVEALAFSLLGPGLLALLPVMVIPLMCLISELHRFASADTLCPDCHKVLVGAPEVSATKEPVRREAAVAVGRS